MQAHRTRIKICGLSQQAEVEHASRLGADAIGLVFYSRSPRYVSVSRALELARSAAPFVAVVGLFVNPDDAFIREVCETVPLTLLQLHGDETPQRCAELGALAGLPWLRACAVGARGASNQASAHLDVIGRADLVEYAANYANAKGLLLDAVTQGYGGGGKVFDWSLIPEDIGRRAVLSGGLNEHNVRDAIAQVRPYAVDVSSGVEVPGAKGVKDLGRITAFIEAVRRADTDIMTGASVPDGV